MRHPIVCSRSLWALVFLIMGVAMASGSTAGAEASSSTSSSFSSSPSSLTASSLASPQFVTVDPVELFHTVLAGPRAHSSILFITSLDSRDECTNCATIERMLVAILNGKRLNCTSSSHVDCENGKEANRARDNDGDGDEISDHQVRFILFDASRYHQTATTLGVKKLPLLFHVPPTSSASASASAASSSSPEMKPFSLDAATSPSSYHDHLFGRPLTFEHICAFLKEKTEDTYAVCEAQRRQQQAMEAEATAAAPARARVGGRDQPAPPQLVITAFSPEGDMDLRPGVAVARGCKRRRRLRARRRIDVSALEGDDDGDDYGNDIFGEGASGASPSSSISSSSLSSSAFGSRLKQGQTRMENALNPPHLLHPSPPQHEDSLWFAKKLETLVLVGLVVYFGYAKLVQAHSRDIVLAYARFIFCSPWLYYGLAMTVHLYAITGMGYMRIRSAPFIAANAQRQILFFHPSSMNQFGNEVVTIGTLQVLLSLAALMLAHDGALVYLVQAYYFHTRPTPTQAVTDLLLYQHANMQRAVAGTGAGAGGLTTGRSNAPEIPHPLAPTSFFSLQRSAGQPGPRPTEPSAAAATAASTTATPLSSLPPDSLSSPPSPPASAERVSRQHVSLTATLLVVAMHLLVILLGAIYAKKDAHYPLKAMYGR